jgi:hypothetical protein
MEKFNDFIRDTDGKIIQKSRNLAGIRRYVSNHVIKVLSISPIGNEKYPEGKLLILFEDRSSFETNFASYHVLRNMVRNWRNVYGSPLVVAGQDCGKVEFKNPFLNGP